MSLSTLTDSQVHTGYFQRDLSSTTSCYLLLLVSFLPARRYGSAVLAVTLCLSATVTSRSSIETAERIELVFGTESPFHIRIGTVLQENLDIYLFI